MKKLQLILLLFLTPVLFAAELPKICLNMIVKNESQVIERCLASVKPMIDYWVIVDTGSTDGTQEIIKNFMKDIPGDLYERPWFNFEHNRNEALELALGKSQYILIIDADDILLYEPDFKLPKLDKEGYYMKIEYGGTTYSRIHLFRNSSDWKWGGVIHEALIGPSYKVSTYLEGVKMKIIGGGDRSNDPDKYKRDAAILEKALEKEPNHTRYTFYLAQSYHNAGMPEKAIEVYERRIALGGWEQEIFWSLYQIAIAKETLKLSEEEISKAYYRAYEYMPTRAEPLYRLCNYYRLKGHYLIAYNLAKFGLDLEEPERDLFTESWIYQYGLLLEYSINAYWVGHYVECLKACKDLLADPNIPQGVRECTEKNMGFAIDKLSPESKKKHAKV